MIAYREIQLGGGDEVACLRCSSTQAAVPVAVDELRQRIEEVRAEDPRAGVFFTDTGPGDHPELRGLVEHAVRAGASRIGVRTSGRSLADPGAASDLLASGVRVVEVTLLGSRAETHDALAGLPGSFEATTTGVANLLGAAESLGVSVAVRGRVHVCRHTLIDLPATVVHLAELRVSSVVLAHDPELDPRRSVEWVGAACDTGTVNRVWVSVSGMPSEALGEKALHAVDPLSLTGTSA